jgi:hypothetical protein
MDFKKVLKVLATEFAEKNISYTLIGGIALGMRGITRATTDIDFLVNKKDAALIKEILGSYGYSCVYESDNTVQFTSDLKPLGAVDFIYAFRPISLKMIEDSDTMSVFNGEFDIPVARPEDIIGLKIQALVNNPQRTAIDSRDIENLIDVHAQKIDWEKLDTYFALFELTMWYNELKGKYGC